MVCLDALRFSRAACVWLLRKLSSEYIGSGLLSF
jgi:hypothetical protein